MIDYSKRFPLSTTLTKFTNTQISNALEGLGDCYPCTVTNVQLAPDGVNVVPIVTVKFEVVTDYPLPEVTIPVIGSEYIRVPIRVGCQGLAIPATAMIGNITGLGSTFSGLTTPASLEALTFVPIGNAVNWPVIDPNTLRLYSVATGAIVSITPTDVVITTGSTIMDISPAGVAITGNVTITGNITTTGTLTNNGHAVGSTHKHSGVTAGLVNTGVPT